jgi:hypothetical protein
MAPQHNNKYNLRPKRNISKTIRMRKISPKKSFSDLISKQCFNVSPIPINIDDLLKDFNKYIEEYDRGDDSDYSDEKNKDKNGKNNRNNKNRKRVEQNKNCKNPTCDHKSGQKLSKNENNIEKINDISDIIMLGKSYHCKRNTHYNGLDLKIMFNLVDPLVELNDMVGMQNIKTNIVNQILYFLRGYNKNNKCNSCANCTFDLKCSNNSDDMLHTVITGPPGTGKTQVGKILGKVYKEMGILENGNLKVVTRSDLIGKYLGHTAAKTQAVIDACKGGVLFIDEAYSLGNAEGRDSFSKECIDTINQNLSERRDFLCIIAGYKDALEKCFFSMNDGLRRRFSFRYDISGYDYKELCNMYLLKVKHASWTCDVTETELDTFFNNYYSNFTYFGGDIETFVLNCKIAHSRTMSDDLFEKSITMDDMNRAIEMLMNARTTTNTNIESFYT